MHPSRCGNRKVYRSGWSTKKSTHFVVKFFVQKCVGMQFHEKCFSIWSRTSSYEMRAKVGVYAS